MKNEDLSIINNDKKYKNFYIYIKKEINKKKVGDNNINNKYDYIHWNSFNNITILEDGVCGGKICCIKVTLNNKDYILKEAGKSMNYGEVLFDDKCKSIFNIIDLNMKLIKSNVGLVKKDKQKLSYVNNWKLDNKDVIYCMMDYKDNIGDLGKNKHIINNDSIKYDCLKIRLFDGLFRSSDNILRNILVTKENKLISIDEGDIYGKRTSIFNKHDWCKENIDLNIFKKVINDLLSNKDYKKKYINNLLIELELSKHCNEFNDRFDNYENIVLNEIS